VNKVYLTKRYGVENIKALYDKEVKAMKATSYLDCKYPVCTEGS
jgi:hypothetical protein